MKKKALYILFLTALLLLTSCGMRSDGIVRTDWSHTYEGYPVVYITPDVSDKGLLSVYEALELPSGRNAAIKLSNTENDPGFTWPDLLEALTEALDTPTFIEDPSHMNFASCEQTLILSHFRRHDGVGMNGAIKQTAFLTSTCDVLDGPNRLEALAEAGKQTVDSLDGQVLYISVMDRLSIESGGITLPQTSPYNVGILASYDPVALDQACVDLVRMVREGRPLAAHIDSCNGIDTLLQAERLGLGSRTYALMMVDEKAQIRR